jgi:hypothetical protein
VRGSETGVICTIKKVRHYTTLQQYIDAEGWKEIAPHTNSNEAALKAYKEVKMPDGSPVFSDKRVADRGGINAVELVVQSWNCYLCKREGNLYEQCSNPEFCGIINSKFMPNPNGDGAPPSCSHV